MTSFSLQPLRYPGLRGSTLLRDLLHFSVAQVQPVLYPAVICATVPYCNSHSNHLACSPCITVPSYPRPSVMLLYCLLHSSAATTIQSSAWPGFVSAACTGPYSTRLESDLPYIHRGYSEMQPFASSTVRCHTGLYNHLQPLQGAPLHGAPILCRT